jgi:hypothetical protein
MMTKPNLVCQRKIDRLLITEYLGQAKLTDLAHVKFAVFTVVTMKNSVFWDIKPSSYFTEDTLLPRYRAQPVNAM